MNSDLRGFIRREQTVRTAFEEACVAHPDRVALVFLGTRYSYAHLRELISRFATAADALGIGPGQRVLIYLPSCPQWIVVYLGLQKIGAVPVPISDAYTPHELVYLLNHSGSETVVCADTNFGYVKEVFPATSLRRIIVTRLADFLPAWKRAFGRIFDKLPGGAVSRDGNVFFLRDLLKRYPPLEHGVDVDPQTHLAHILYTGGTTGHPKGVPHTHAELLSGIIGLRESYRRFLHGSQHDLILPLPLFHMYSQDMIFALGWHLGNTVVIIPRPSADAVLATIQNCQSGLLVGVPTLYRRLLECVRLELYDLATLEYCWSAGDVLPQEVAARWKERSGRPIHQVFGTTETVCISVTELDREPRSGTVGNLLPTREARIVDPETLVDVAGDSAGELLIGSEYSYALGGYWDNPGETAESYVEREGRLWCRTGDYVRFTGEGEIEFIDRRADLIRHKAFKVSASRVESVLQDHPAVVAACVVGTPDAAAGENVKAFVILDEDARGVSSYDLLKHCRERLLPYEVPDYIEFRDMLPKSKVGKLLRRELKDEERRKAAR